MSALKAVIGYATLITLTTLILIISIFIQRNEGQETAPYVATGRTWESCFAQTHCKRPRICLDTLSMVGNVCALNVDTGEQPSEPGDETVTTCHCLPPAGSSETACSSSESCDEQEVCARTGADQDRIVCVSCYALDNLNPFNVYAFEPIDNNDVSQRCNVTIPSPSPSIPTKPDSPLNVSLVTEDYCFIVAQPLSTATEQQDNFKCIDSSCDLVIKKEINFVSNLTAFDDPDSGSNQSDIPIIICGNYDTMCKCKSLVDDSCNTTNDCKAAQRLNEGTDYENRLVCAKNLDTSLKSCMSCSALYKSTNLIPIENDIRSEQCKIRDINKFNPEPLILRGPNGFTFDICDSDASCRDDRICVIDDVGCRQPGAGFCRCQPSNGQLKTCLDSSECENGEVCITIKGKRPSCSSKAIAYYVLEKEAAILSEFSNNTLALESLPDPSTESIPTGSLYTNEICEFDWECGDGRRCTHMTERTYGRCAGRKGCFCKKYIPSLCQRNDDCTDEKEYCVRIIDSPKGLNGTCSTVDYLQKDWYEIIDSNSNNIEIGTKFVEIAGEDDGTIKDVGNRLAGETCLIDNDCSNNRCIHLTEPFGECNQRRACMCARQNCNITTAITKFDRGCETDEICSQVQDEVANLLTPAKCLSKAVFSKFAFITAFASIIPAADMPDPTPSISPTPSLISASPSPSVEESGVCIDVSALEHLNDDEVVFNRNTENRASVLCDDHGSCATAGHIVEWNGKRMMMKRYCELLQSNCVKRVRTVNSPKMKSGIRIPSKTNGLLYTAFAAKYESFVEEKIMQTLLNFV